MMVPRAERGWNENEESKMGEMYGDGRRLEFEWGEHNEV